VTGPNLDFAKQFVTERVLRQALRFLGKDPRQSLHRLLDLGQRLAPLPAQKQKVAGAKRALAENPVLRAYVDGLLAGTASRVQLRLGFNWFVNSTLCGTPKRAAMSEKLGVNVPVVILVDPTSDCNLKCAGCEAGMYERCHTLPFERLDRLAREAKDLGVYWFMLSGGRGGGGDGGPDSRVRQHQPRLQLLRRRVGEHRRPAVGQGPAGRLARVHSSPRRARRAAHSSAFMCRLCSSAGKRPARTSSRYSASAVTAVSPSWAYCRVWRGTKHS